jgi:hypothetical protein
VKRVQWVFKGEERTVCKPNKPSCVNMYAGITKYGVTKAHIVTGTTKSSSQNITKYKNLKGQDAKNITSAEYYDVVRQTLLPEGQRLMGRNGHRSWKLQQDNDPTHKKPSAKAVSEWNAGTQGKVHLLDDWPPNSPDLSPIENAWSCIQARLDSAGCQNLDEFKATLVQEWENIDKKIIRNLMTSLPTRMKKCVDREGRKINY